MDLELAIAQTKIEAFEICGIMYAVTLRSPETGASKSTALYNLFEFSHFFVQYFDKDKWLEIENCLLFKGAWKGLVSGDDYNTKSFFAYFH